MDIRCLIIDRDSTCRAKLETLIKTFRGNFQVQTVDNVTEAIKTIISKDFSLILCDSFLADRKTGLVASIMGKRPGVSLIITSRNDSSVLKEFNTISCVKGLITQPIVQPADLAGKVVLALGSLFYQGNLQSVNCITLIQIFELEGKDFTLRVINTINKIEGMLFINKGILIDAVCGTMAPLKAAERISLWENVNIEVYNTCLLNENRINIDLTSLILQCEKKLQAGKRLPPKSGIGKSKKRNDTSDGGLAGLFLKKAKKK
jgi:hypothetical protein